MQYKAVKQCNDFAKTGGSSNFCIEYQCLTRLKWCHEAAVIWLNRIANTVKHAPLQSLNGRTRIETSETNQCISVSNPIGRFLCHLKNHGICRTFLTWRHLICDIIKSSRPFSPLIWLSNDVEIEYAYTVFYRVPTAVTNDNGSDLACHKPLFIND